MLAVLQHAEKEQARIRFARASRDRHGVEAARHGRASLGRDVRIPPDPIRPVSSQRTHAQTALVEQVMHAEAQRPPSWIQRSLESPLVWQPPPRTRCVHAYVHCPRFMPPAFLLRARFIRLPSFVSCSRTQLLADTENSPNFKQHPAFICVWRRQSWLDNLSRLTLAHGSRQAPLVQRRHPRERR